MELPEPVVTEEVVTELTPAEQEAIRRGPSRDRPVDIACFDPVMVSPPAANFRDIVAQSDPGTCFQLSAGTYTFHDVRPKDYMTFLGNDRDEVVVQGSGSTENAFSGTATGVSIGRMTIVGFQGSGGEARQEQGAIRGTAGIWKSDRGEMATEWLIEDVVVKDNYATGVYLGDHFTVRDSVISGNGVAGLSGSELVGGLVIGNEVFSNGFSGNERSELANAAGMKFGQAGTPDDPLVIMRNELYGNNKIEIWCDIACGGLVVTENYVHDYDRVGIMYEISRNAEISRNLVVQTNGRNRNDWEVGISAIMVRESANVVVEGNYVDGAFSGVSVKQSKRPADSEQAILARYEGVNYVVEQVTVQNNIVRNVRIMGLEVSPDGRGIARLSTVSFVDNRYDDTGAMVFWWEDDRKMDFGQWKARGYDTGPQGGALPAPPPWPPAPLEDSDTADQMGIGTPRGEDS